MSKTFRDWLSEGEQIYSAALGEYTSLETQISELQQKMELKKVDVNEIARVIGKPPVEVTRRVCAEVVEAAQLQATSALPIGKMVRALTGRGATAR